MITGRLHSALTTPDCCASASAGEHTRIEAASRRRVFLRNMTDLLVRMRSVRFVHFFTAGGAAR
jgi:hypothetical protein